MEFLKKISQTYFPQLSGRLLFLCGIIMLSSEIWKQFTLTFLLGGGQYNWWYFPFQLCSIPMYLLIAYPWIRRETLRRVILSFLMCYSLLGGIAVFADTSGLHYPLASLTIHSYLWHIALILIGISAGFLFFRTFRRPSFTRRKEALHAFAGSTGLYFHCCGAAELFNLIFGRFGTINMFYINPAYQMQQIVFSDLSVLIGNNLSILLYMAATVFGAFLLFLLWHALFRFLLHFR